MRLNKLFAAAAVLMFPAIASADPCSGAPPFTDVSALANYCTNTEWLKNRNVTLGCIGTNYCPNDVVTRGSMALFMNRLGVALSPELFAQVDAAPGALDLDLPSPGTLACQTSDYTVTGYPRRILIVGTFAGLAAAALDYEHEIYSSTNGGTTWNFTNSNINRSGTSSGRWISSTTQRVMDVDVGTTIRWAVRLDRSSGNLASTADFDDSRCFLTVTVFNRNGAASPFDVNVGPSDNQR